MSKLILYSHSLYTPYILGGAEISTQILAENVAKTIPTSVMTVGPHKRKIVSEQINGVRVFRLPKNNIYWQGEQKERGGLEKMLWHSLNMYNLRQKKLAALVIKGTKPSLLHSQNMSGLSLAVWAAAKERNIPIVHTLRDYSLFQPTDNGAYASMYLKLARHMSRHVDCVVGISKFILDKHLEQGMFRDAKTFVIGNPLDSGVEVVTRPEVSTGLKICFVGQVEPRKGVEYLLRAVRGLPEDIVHQLTVVGDGSDKKRLEQLFKGDSRIVFVGKKSSGEVAAIASRQDVTVVPSLWDEPFGRVIIESYQNGTPVLAARVGGIPEVVVDQQHLFSPSDEEAIRQAIRRFHAIPLSERERLRESCLAYSKKFHSSNITTSYLELYESYLSE
ncbi:glycosyltransferase family 4 protein [Paenibacillus sp. TRM 82003]|nr:glycosyltransferase family 4 protein [Paenibacillus sp. TRM 82003]